MGMIQALQQKPNDDPFEFLERIYQAYRKHTDANLQAPETVQMMKMSFIGQSALDISKKFQSLDGALGMNSSQPVGIAFKVCNAKEARKIKHATVFLETG